MKKFLKLFELKKGAFSFVSTFFKIYIKKKSRFYHNITVMNPDEYSESSTKFGLFSLGHLSFYTTAILRHKTFLYTIFFNKRECKLLIKASCFK